jgi:hypothetical protein
LRNIKWKITSQSSPCEGGDKGEVIKSSKIPLDIEQIQALTEKGKTFNLANKKKCGLNPVE